MAVVLDGGEKVSEFPLRTTQLDPKKARETPSHENRATQG